MNDMKFICPKDGKELINKIEYLFCEECNESFKKEKNLIRFLNYTDDFYEGSFNNRVNFLPTGNRFFDNLALWAINSGYLYQVQKIFKHNDTLLELGCAGGVAYFGKEFNMIGCDLSLSSLEYTQNIYSYCIQADPLESIPLPENSLDGIVSSYFWEHLNATEKNACLRECHRVLKTDGKMVFLYDVETQNPLVKYYKKKNPYLYKKHFLDQDGHMGYASIKENLTQIRNNNFEILHNLGLQKTFLQEPSVYLKLLHWNRFKPIISLLSYLNKPLLLKPYLFLIRLADFLFILLPDSWSRVCLTISRVEK